jgi:hypothetical protein
MEGLRSSMRRSSTSPACGPVSGRGRAGPSLQRPDPISAATASRSRRASRPSFAINVPLSEIRGRRECRALDAPAASCVKNKTHELVTTVTPESPGIPRAMVLTAYIALSPVTGLSCHRRLRNRFRKLDASVGASGPHDFAVRKQALSSAAPPPSTASRLASVTIASRPSVRRNRWNVSLIWGQVQRRRLRQIGTTGKSASGVVIVKGLAASDAGVRHCEEPTGRANARPMTGSATKQSIRFEMDCFASLAMTNLPPATPYSTPASCGVN